MLSLNCQGPLERDLIQSEGAILRLVVQKEGILPLLN